MTSFNGTVSYLAFLGLWKKLENFYQSCSWDIERYGTTSRESPTDPSTWCNNLILKRGSRTGLCRYMIMTSVTWSTLSIQSSDSFWASFSARLVMRGHRTLSSVTLHVLMARRLNGSTDMGRFSITSRPLTFRIVY